MSMLNSDGRLHDWSKGTWNFPLVESEMGLDALEMSLLNGYSTCVRQVQSLMADPYFSEAWVFQEMMLAKDVGLWGFNDVAGSYISLGDFRTWADAILRALGTCRGLQGWIKGLIGPESATVNAVLNILDEDLRSLETLPREMDGINDSRADILKEGSLWWHNGEYRIANLFSVYSSRPRVGTQGRDIFSALLGIFSGLFTPNEIRETLTRHIAIDDTSFVFLQRLSLATGCAWTRRALSYTKRTRFNWIPAERHNGMGSGLSSEFFADVFCLGRLTKGGLVRTPKYYTGLSGVPRQYMTINFQEKNRNPKFRFVFTGCNCGKEIRTSSRGTKPIPPAVGHSTFMRGMETGEALVRSATILGSFLVTGDMISTSAKTWIVRYRRELLSRLDPHWHVSNPDAIPVDWMDECVRGTPWEPPRLQMGFHNMSVNYTLEDLTDCGSRLYDKRRASMMCELTVNCGCTIVAPLPFIMEALIASAVRGKGRYSGPFSVIKSQSAPEPTMPAKDELGLRRLAEPGNTWHMLAFGGDTEAHVSEATRCRKTDSRVTHLLTHWPEWRALVGDNFQHSRVSNMLRKYGTLDSKGCSPLLISRESPVSHYSIIGIWMDGGRDDWAIRDFKKSSVTIQ